MRPGNGTDNGSALVNFSLDSEPLGAELFHPRRDTLVVWLGMAGVFVNARGTILFIDPLLTAIRRADDVQSETGHRFRIALPIEAKNVPRADAVLYTHADRDHFGRATARVFVHQQRTPIYGPPPVLERMVEIGVDAKSPAYAGRMNLVRDFEDFSIGEAEIRVTPTLHDIPRGGRWRPGDACGYLIRTPDGTIWHPGDTRLIEKLLTVKDVDVMFFDVADVEAHLGPAGSARLGQSCGAQVLFAFHYRTFEMPAGSYGGCDPRDALPYVRDLSARFLIYPPGKPLRLPL